MTFAIRKKIPDNMRPWSCEVNGVKYVYPAGTEQDVPEEVAAIIDAYWASKEKVFPNTAISFNELKDRPFGEDRVVVFEYAGELEYIDGPYGIYLPEQEYPLSVGDKVYVTVNGVETSMTAWGDEWNPGICFLGKEGDPFRFATGNSPHDGRFTWLTFTGPTVDVKIENVTIEKLDPKFLPGGGGGVTKFYVGWQYGPYLYKTTNYGEEDKASKDEVMECARNGIILLANVGEEDGDSWEEYIMAVTVGTGSDYEYAYVYANNYGPYYSKEYVYVDGGDS